MTGTKGEESIVKGHDEKGGRKRVNDDKDAHPAKREKVDGSEAAGCRNLGTKLQSLTMTRDKAEEGEGEELKEKIDLTVTCDKAEGEEEELKEKIDRICEWLEDDPKKLRNKDVEDVILYFDVNEIISLALKSDRANRRKAFHEYGYLEGGLEGNSFVPSGGKVLGLLTLMQLSGIEKLKEGDLYILYQNFPKLPFAQLLLSALGDKASHALSDKADERVMIGRLCYALPWKLFTHIMYHKTLLPQFKRSEEEEKSNNECTIQKKAAESCEICCGKGKHSGVYGYHCSFWYSVPSGLTVGPSHWVCCRECKDDSSPNEFTECHCGSRIGQAVPHSMIWEI